jgi:anti-anti-sigma factor
MGKPGGPLEVAFQHTDDGAVLTLVGAVDTATVEPLTKDFARAVALIGNGKLVVDLSGLQFYDAAGLSALARSVALAEHHGVTIVLRNLRILDPSLCESLELGSVVHPLFPSVQASDTSWEGRSDRRSPWDPPDWAPSRAIWPSSDTPPIAS